MRTYAGLFILLLIAMGQVVHSAPGVDEPPADLKESFWAFQPVLDPQLPTVKATNWPRSPVDHFVLQQLEARGLEPAPPADKRTLIRRATFDLIGLPPTPQEIDAFLADDSPEAFTKVVDRLLASPHYGERWGRHWMDLVRYADTAGDNADYPVPEVRLYRDYIIDSFNADKPYDQFVREQLAGDILAAQGPRDKYAERVIATGFIALSRRYATAPFEFMHLTIEDTIETTGRVFLGLTLRCARCHDHKFDPVTVQDYYGLYGFFASTEYPYAGSEEFQSKSLNRTGFVPLLPPDEAKPLLMVHQQEIERVQAEIKSTEQDDPLAKRVTELKQQIEAKSREVRERETQKDSPQRPMKPEAEDLDTLKAEAARLQKEHDEANAQLQAKLKPMRDELRRRQRPGLPPDLPGAYAVRESQAVDSHIQVRGNPADQGRQVSRCPPRFLAADQAFAIPAGSSGRLELARWLTRPDHPLTARVMVNRIWQHHFGKPIVGTASNFGLRGDRPTHPALLDWLAARFVESGWSIKAVHRLIMLSQTYQLASTWTRPGDLPAPPLAKGGPGGVDPGNRCYWRFERRRLDAEAIRDAMLAVGGNLDLSRPGPHPFPPIEQWNWTQHQPFKAAHPSNHRSVYLMTQRIQRHPYLALFDGPDTNYSTDVRTSATVPLQALFMMNNPFVYDQARGFARRLIAASPDARQRIELAHKVAWGRPPTALECDKATAYLESYSQELVRTGVPGDQVELEAWSSYVRVMLTANEFVYVD